MEMLMEEGEESRTGILEGSPHARATVWYNQMRVRNDRAEIGATL